MQLRTSTRNVPLTFSTLLLLYEYCNIFFLPTLYEHNIVHLASVCTSVDKPHREIYVYFLYWWRYNLGWPGSTQIKQHPSKKTKRDNLSFLFFFLGGRLCWRRGQLNCPWLCRGSLVTSQEICLFWLCIFLSRSSISILESLFSFFLPPSFSSSTSSSLNVHLVLSFILGFPPSAAPVSFFSVYF